jgi:hypothetical protein
MTFKKVVTLYQMCVKDSKAFPYTIDRSGNLDKLDLSKVQKELTEFYGADHPIANHIIEVLKKNFPDPATTMQ